jgi:hypothetical protein
MSFAVSEAAELTITTAAGHCTGIYVVSMNGEIGGGDEVSEDDVVTVSGTARGGARCAGRLP